MEFITAAEAARRWGVSERRVQRLCAEGRVPGAERFGRDDRFGRGDRAKPHARGDRRPEGRGFGGRDARRDFGVRSGPRARAFETRRYAERSDFAKNAVVRIDADLADFFGSPEAVNKALRALVEAQGLNAEDDGHSPDEKNSDDIQKST